MGRAIQHLRLKVNVPDLERLMLDVIETVRPREVHLQHIGQNHSYRVRITPYRTMDNRIEGVVLAFVDMSGLKQSPTLPGAVTKQARNAAPSPQGQIDT